MNLQEPYRIYEIDYNNIVLRKLKESNKRKIIFLKYRDTNIKNFVFQLPKLVNNISVVDNQLSIPLLCNNEEKETQIVKFFNDIDNKIMEIAKTKPEWFEHFTDTSNIKYQRIVQDMNDLSCIKVNIIDNDDFKTQLLINDKEEIEVDEIPNDGFVKIILECYAVWVANNSFGILLRPIIVSFKQVFSYNYRLISDSETESDFNDKLFIKNTLHLNIDDDCSST